MRTQPSKGWRGSRAACSRAEWTCLTSRSRPTSLTRSTSSCTSREGRVAATYPKSWKSTDMSPTRTCSTTERSFFRTGTNHEHRERLRAQISHCLRVRLGSLWPNRERSCCGAQSRDRQDDSENRPCRNGSGQRVPGLACQPKRGWLGCLSGDESHQGRCHEPDQSQHKRYSDGVSRPRQERRRISPGDP